MNEPVLDASALLAYLNAAEPGAKIVEEALGEGVRVGAVNWAEVLSKGAEKGAAPEALEGNLERSGILGQALKVVPLTREDALTVGKLRPRTKDAGLSLADGRAWRSPSGSPCRRLLWIGTGKRSTPRTSVPRCASCGEENVGDIRHHSAPRVTTKRA